MLTVANLVALAFKLGFSLTFNPVADLDYAAKYWNDEENIMYDCTTVQLDIGLAAVCQSSTKSAIVYVEQKP